METELALLNRVLTLVNTSYTFPDLCPPSSRAHTPIPSLSVIFPPANPLWSPSSVRASSKCSATQIAGSSRPIPSSASGILRWPPARWVAVCTHLCVCMCVRVCVSRYTPAPLPPRLGCGPLSLGQGTGGVRLAFEPAYAPSQRAWPGSRCPIRTVVCPVAPLAATCALWCAVAWGLVLSHEAVKGLRLAFPKARLRSFVWGRFESWFGCRKPTSTISRNEHFSSFPVRH